MNSINSSDISIVVQGATDKNTQACLRSLRHVFPAAEIILSTWENTDVKGLEYDKLLLNKDPGGFKDLICHTFTNNLLRQLISTQAGLAAANGNYILKIRSDLYFTKDCLAKCMRMFPQRDEKFSVFKSRLLASSFFTKKYLYSNQQIHPVPFHISDWFIFGLKEDVRKFYDITLPQEPQQAHFFHEHPYTGGKTNLLGCSHQYAPEQFITWNCFKNNFPNIQMNDYMDYNQENIELSEKIIVNNFSIFSPKDIGFYCLKSRTNNDFYKKWSKHSILLPYNVWIGLYRNDVYWKDYIKYCDNKAAIPFNTRLKYISSGVIKKWIHKLTSR